MAETTTITVRVPAELRDDLDRLASITRRSRSFLAAQALEIYTRYELEIVEGILQGMKDADEGRVFTTAQMRQKADDLLAQVKATKPAKKVAAG